MAITFNIRPAAGGTVSYDTWTLGAGSSKWAAVDPGNPLAHDDDTSYVSKTDPTTGRQTFFLGTRPGMFTVSEVKIYVRGKNINNYTGSQAVDAFARRAGTDGSSVTFTGLGDAVGLYTEGSAALPRPGGGVWTVADLNDSSLEIGVNLATWVGGDPGVHEFRVTSIWLQVTYTPLPTQTEQARTIGAQILRMFRRPFGLLDIDVSLAVGLDVELLDTIWITHPYGPSEDGNGWNQKAMIVMRREVVVDRGYVRLSLFDPRFYLTSFWDTGKAKKFPSIFGDGIGRLDGGNVRTFSRDSPAWIENPGDGKVLALDHDTEKYAGDLGGGELLEGERTNHLLRTSDGTTSWTLNQGLGRGTITNDTTDLLFDPSVSTNSMKLETSAAQSLDLFATKTTGSLSGNTKVRLSVDHKDNSGVQMTLRLSRGFDGAYWRDSDGTWQVGAQNISPAISQTTIARFKSKEIDVGGNATTLTLSVMLLNGVGNSKVAHMYHEQIESGTGNAVTSRIKSSNTAVTRKADRLLISNNNGVRAWPADRGTLFFQIVPEWNDEASTPNRTFFYVEHDALNYEHIYWEHTGNVVIFERKVSGTVYQTAKGASWSVGDVISIGARWLGARSEYGLAPYTMSLFINKVKGVDVVSVAPVPANTENLEIGSQNGLQNADALFRNIWITPQILKDGEMGRLP
jgi:hypothetical protein